MAGGRDELLQQHDIAAERLKRLGPRAIESGAEAAEVVDAADPASPSPGGRLDHQREPDPVRVRDRIVVRRHGATAPGRDRHPGGLGEPLGGDLVADQAHDRRIGTDEHDPEPGAEIRELGLLGDESPADPCGVGARLDQRSLERHVVEVAAALAIVTDRRPERRRLIRMTDEHRVALALRVERNQPDRLLSLLVEFPDGMDQPHRGLATIDDRQT